MATAKIFETAAFIPENGRDAASPQSLGWGDPLSRKIPAAGDGFPWLDFGHEVGVEQARDESVTTNAAETTPVTTGLRVDNPLEFHARFTDLDHAWYWLMGWSGDTVEVFKFEADTPWASTEPAAGTAYTQSALNFVYLRTEPAMDVLGEEVNYYIFSGPAAPTATGTLTGSSDFTYTAVSVKKTERLYELDALGRQYRDYTTAEQTVDGWLAGDKKNIMATIAKRFELHDMRFSNAMCSKFSFVQSGETYAKIATNFLAYKQERSSSAGGYGSADWSNAPSLANGDSSPVFHQSTVHIGTTVGVIGTDAFSLTKLCTNTFGFDIDMPLKQEATSCSGLSIAEPVMSGKYSIKMNATLARYSDKIYMDQRDASVKSFARFAFYHGDDMIEVLMKNIVFDKADPTGDEVAMNQLNGSVNYTDPASDEWVTSGWLEGQPQFQNMPLIIRIRNDSTENPMLQY